MSDLNYVVFPRKSMYLFQYALAKTISPNQEEHVAFYKRQSLIGEDNNHIDVDGFRIVWWHELTAEERRAIRDFVWDIAQRGEPCEYRFEELGTQETYRNGNVCALPPELNHVRELKNYAVTIEVTGHYEIAVSAQNPDAAREKAQELVNRDCCGDYCRNGELNVTSKKATAVRAV